MMIVEPLSGGGVGGSVCGGADSSSHGAKAFCQWAAAGTAGRRTGVFVTIDDGSGGAVDAGEAFDEHSQQLAATFASYAAAVALANVHL